MINKRRAYISGARITFIERSPPPNVVTYVNSDASGQAVFKGLKAATYTINAQRRGHLTPGLADIISRTIGTTRRHQVDVLLPPDTTVSGRVLDPNGIPVVEAQVALTKVSYFEGRRLVVRMPIETVRTDDRGEYRIAWVDPGDYIVQVELGDTLGIGWESYWETFPRVIYYPGVVDPKTATLVSCKAALKSAFS